MYHSAPELRIRSVPFWLKFEILALRLALQSNPSSLSSISPSSDLQQHLLHCDSIMPSERPRKVQGFNDLEDQVEDGGSDIDHDAEDDPREDSDDASGPAESSRAASNKRKRDPEASSDRKGKSKSKRKAPTPGIVYISRLPPGMTPQKVRHLMARWGEVGKVYAQRRDG